MKGLLRCRYLPMISSLVSREQPDLCNFSSFFKPFDTSKNDDEPTHNSESNAEYCINLMKKHDYETYLACLLLPDSVMRAGFAIRAFNVELALIRDLVSEKSIGAMRMQFWRDAVNKVIEGDPPQAPVAEELAGAARFFELPKQPLKNIVEARTEQLEIDGFQSVYDLEKYAEKTASSLHYLMLKCLGVRNIHADHAASHLGKAQGLTTVLRATPFHATKRRVYLPQDLLIEQKLSAEDVIRGRIDLRLLDVVYQVATTANKHLEKARAIQTEIELPKPSLLAFLNVLPTSQYLKKLEKANFNVYDSKLKERNPHLAMQLWMQRYKEKY